MERLLAMQNDSSMLVRAKAQSVFRACVEQIEMYKDTTAYTNAVRTIVDAAMGPWLVSLNQSLGTDVAALSGQKYSDAVKLIRSTHKVRSHLPAIGLAIHELISDAGVIRPSLSVRPSTAPEPPPHHNPHKPRHPLPALLPRINFSLRSPGTNTPPHRPVRRLGNRPACASIQPRGERF